ncbi:intraflagellar transport protein 22 homolog isoform X1 [Syngnathus typhle]|uniref:intraflagellar transport protein 22 homolog isoform X1 n=1 Tax=Syngnathus typhle TaxID=161592 RepID=UPI002A6B300C|nr:intraflagellar transport protein 22 homolog isoform X1 [Syngnathus typhle]XP_061151621.1 intraflagellar transport protein 22 homolog isoform X1 [Syngnathus typhle]XP_061151622.1 intraflagellar transport protein 22 homolog isoform X1 [Syngnathus typhle]
MRVAKPSSQIFSRTQQKTWEANTDPLKQSGTSYMTIHKCQQLSCLRILEFESQLDGYGDVKSCEVELWDCSGDFKFESCWPALTKDSSGVVIIFNPDVPSHLKEIETWHSMFISSQGLQDSQCLLIAHHKPGSAIEEGRLPLASQLSRLPLIHSEIEEEPEDLRRAFCRYLGKVVNTLSESREREEMSIIT